MSFIDPKAFPLIPEIDLLDPTAFKVMQKAFRMPEIVAQQSHQAFAVISLNPSRIIYTSENFIEYAAFELIDGAQVPLLLWLNSLHTCSGLPIDQYLRPMLVDLEKVSIIHHVLAPRLIFDYCANHASKGNLYLQQQVCPLRLEQKNPHMAYLVSIQQIQHFHTPFSHEIKLMLNNTVWKRELFSPPLQRHPLLKNLSSTESKVVKYLFYEGNQKDIYLSLNMSLDTLKSHRKHILKKTGFPNTEALLAVLKWEMGEVGI